jgi:myo-inositol catabolism protein IolS
MKTENRQTLKLSTLGIGCWSFGGGEYWGEQPQLDVDKIVSAALDGGVTYFDTAEAYNDGNSEKSLGKALKNRRSEAIIGTKIWPDNCGLDSTIAHCEASLKRLGTDYIDIYMVHWPLENYEGTAEALYRLLEQGKILQGGVSNFGPLQMEEAEAAGLKFSVNQVIYNLLARAAEFSVASESAKRNVAVMGYMPLMQGLLSAKFKSTSDIPPERMRTRHFSGNRTGSRHGGPGYENNVFELVSAVERAAAKHDVAPAAASLAWCISRPEIRCEIAGIRSLTQLETSLTAMEIAENSELMRELDQASLILKAEMGESIDYWDSSENSRSR